jgi:hypothetical protein
MQKDEEIKELKEDIANVKRAYDQDKRRFGV